MANSQSQNLNTEKLRRARELKKENSSRHGTNLIVSSAEDRRWGAILTLLSRMRDAYVERGEMFNFHVYFGGGTEYCQRS